MSLDDLRKQNFYWAILEALFVLGGSGSNQEIESAVVDRFDFSDDQLAVTHEKSGTPVIPNRIAWARSDLKLAELVTNERTGVWALTDQGREILAKDEDAVQQRVADAIRRYHAERREAQEDANEDSGALEDVDDEIEWSNVLLSKLKSIPPDAFERLAQRLLRESGFVKVEVTGKSGDGGIDGNGILRMNLVSFNVLFQCKRYSGSVGPGVVRDFRGAMQGRADKGLIITTGSFTPEARKEAGRDGAPAIDLIDGDALCDLLKQQRLGVRVKMVEEVELDLQFFDGI